MVRALASHQCGLGSIPVQCHILALLQGVFSGFSGFPLSTKANIFKFQFSQDSGPSWIPAKGDVAVSLNIVIYLFMYVWIELINFAGG